MPLRDSDRDPIVRSDRWRLKVRETDEAIEAQQRQDRGQTPRGLIRAFFNCTHMVEEAGLDRLTAMANGDLSREQHARQTQGYWMNLRSGWESDLRALARRECRE